MHRGVASEVAPHEGEFVGVYEVVAAQVGVLARCLLKLAVAVKHGTGVGALAGVDARVDLECPLGLANLEALSALDCDLGHNLHLRL